MAEVKESQYEMSFVLIDTDNAALDAIREDVKSSLGKRNAKITKAETMGTKPLFHEKNHHQRGNFNCWHLSAPKESIGQIQADINLNSKILKAMIVKIG